MGVTTPESSELCVSEQKQKGCHGCGRRGSCWSAASNCHAKCTRTRHVCDPAEIGKGCTSCDKACHPNNSDLRCRFFQRRRGDIEWQADAQALLDTLHGNVVNVPHRTQLSWRLDGYTERGAVKVNVDGVEYFEGFGNPGRQTDGEQHNCLIDSLRQCLSIECDRRLVCEDLIREFSGAVGRAKVEHASYLDAEEHGRAIIRSLFRHNSSGLPSEVDLDNYCVVALPFHSQNNGVVVGNVRAPERLVVSNHSDVHFNPCLRLG